MSAAHGWAQPEVVHGNAPQLTAVAVPQPLSVAGAHRREHRAAAAGRAADLVDPYLRQAPAPSHVPSLPQLSGVPGSQLSCGSMPALTAPHLPLAMPVYVSAHA